MTSPVGKGKTVVTSDDAFDALVRGEVKEQAKKLTAPVKNALRATSDTSIERSNAFSKNISAQILSTSITDITAKSIDTAEPISKKAFWTAVNTGVDLITNRIADKGVDWAKKH